MNPDFKQMAAECAEIRNTIIDICHGAGSGHCGGSLSSVEIMWTLYSCFLKVKPGNPEWDARDRFILSKGHAAPSLYTVLSRKGFFDAEKLKTLRRTGTMLQGHPDMNKTPGVDMSTGSLGMGISVGVGMALAARLSKLDYRAYVLVGDGELQEGQNWEGLMSARKFELSKLIIIVDNNGVQLDGTTEEIMPMLDIAGKIEQFGFDVQKCNGHNCEDIYHALQWAQNALDRPRAIIADTVKGKGISFMEGDHAWHGKPLSDEDYHNAVEELRISMEKRQ